MTALLDNYSLFPHSQPIVNSVLDIFQELTSFSNDRSIVISNETSLGLNNHIFRLLDHFATLEENWDDDGAIKITEKVIANARYITSLMQKSGQLIYHSAPGPNGEVMLDIRNVKKSKSIEIVIYPNRTILVEFPVKGRPSQLNFDLEQLKKSLKWLNSNL